MFGAQPDDLRLWVETGEHWQAQDLNTAEAAKVDQYVAAVEAFAASNTVILAPADELGVETWRRRWARQANPFPDASPVLVATPLTADDKDETLFPWPPGQMVGMVARG